MIRTVRYRMYIIVLCIAGGYSLYAMHTLKFHAAFGSSLVLYNHYHNYQHYRNKDLFSISDVNDQLIKSSDQKKSELHTTALKNLPGQTRRHAEALHQWRWSCNEQEVVADTAEFRYRRCLDDILKEFYKDGWLTLSSNNREKLIDAMVILTKQEEQFSDTHYAFYHGTDEMHSIIKRTQQFSHTTQQEMPHYFLFRQPGFNQFLHAEDDVIGYVRRSVDEYHKQITGNDAVQRQTELSAACTPFGGSSRSHSVPKTFNHEQASFLSVNTAVLANSWPSTVKGSNSLRFITPVAIENDWITALFPAWSKGICENPLYYSIRTVHTKYRHYYGYPIEADNFKKMEHAVSGLVQILIPKESCSRIFNCGSFNIPTGTYASATMNRQAKLTDEYVDSGHASIPLDPGLFENHQSGIIMGAILFGNKEDVLKTMKKV